MSQWPADALITFGRALPPGPELDRVRAEMRRRILAADPHALDPEPEPLKITVIDYGPARPK